MVRIMTIILLFAFFRLSAQVEINIPENSELIINQISTDTVYIHNYIEVPVYDTIYMIDTVFIEKENEPRPETGKIVLLRQDFEHRSEGDYRTSYIYEDFWNENVDSVFHAKQNAQIVTGINGNNSKVLKCVNPAGFVGYDNSWNIALKDTYDDIYISCDVYLPIDAGIGGKLFGATGHPYFGVAGEGISWNEMANARLMFKSTPAHGSNMWLVSYVYHHDMDGSHGNSQSVGGYFPRHKWVNVTIRLVNNSVNPVGELLGIKSAGNNDGIMEVYYDGKLHKRFEGFRFRNLSKLGWNIIRFNWFYGGSGSAWSTPNDETAYFDNFEVYIKN